MSKPLDVAFVWHMHQPDYRSARTGSFEMPWVRMHALKDYLDMVKTLEDYPRLHQTFNLVPSLVEQLQDYDSGDFSDVYWQHTLKPAEELDETERAFLLARMCDHSDHPRARAHPRYLQLAHKRDSLLRQSTQAAAQGFTTQELVDLQVWLNLAWFGARALREPGLDELIGRGCDYHEEDKRTIADAQKAIIGQVLPAYRQAAQRGQVELTTSPYFHPILPLLCDTDSARIATAELRLPPRRFAHPQDATEQLRAAALKHEQVFGSRPRGVWCSEMAVGEAVIPLLSETGFEWTISDEAVLERSLSGVTPRPAASHAKSAEGPYWAYRLGRDSGDISIVFRDHTLSDLIGFSYKSWDSRNAADDLVSRLRDLRRRLPMASAPLVVVALDGENAWEYYPNEGREFLAYLYEALADDGSLRCVTVSEHLRESPPRRRLDWLHTGSWISADLSTWCGTVAHGSAWDQLHSARDAVERARRPGTGAPPDQSSDGALETAWRHVQVAEGSDWFWWFGDHHHTELDSVWDHEFRLRLQEVYRLLDQPVPPELLAPLAETLLLSAQTMPLGPVSAQIDGIITQPDEWGWAGFLAPDTNAAMHPSTAVRVHGARFGWLHQRICLLVEVDPSSLHEGLWIEVVTHQDGEADEIMMRVTLQDGGTAQVSSLRPGLSPDRVQVAWKEVVEMSVQWDEFDPAAGRPAGLAVRVGLGQLTAQEFHSSGALATGAVSS